MRPITVDVSAPGNSPWIPVNYLQNAFGIGLGVSPSFDAATVSYTVQHVFDDISVDAQQQISLARVGTAVTATFQKPHKLVVGDSLIVISSGSSQMDSQQPSGLYISWDVATVPSATTLTYTVANAGPTADGGNAKAITGRVFPHASLAAQSTRQDGNYAFNVMAIRLKLLTLTAGSVSLSINQGLGR